MGKYMRKPKMTGDVALMDVVSQSSFGVRTRAKTLALQQRLQSTTAPPPPKSPNSELSYLQLRSRRLEKVPPSPNDSNNLLHPAATDVCRCNPKPIPNPNRSLNPSSRTSSRLRPRSVNSGSVGSVSISCSRTTRVWNDDEAEDRNDLGTEASLGEINLDFESRERSTRESTPCSLIRGSDTVGTPCSTTKQTASTAANRRIQNAMQRNIPTTHEMEEFFACVEQQQQRLFTEKYNFDVVNELPLPGRYEWVKVHH